MRGRVGGREWGKAPLESIGGTGRYSETGCVNKTILSTDDPRNLLGLVNTPP